MNLSDQSLINSEITDSQLKEWLNIHQEINNYELEELKELYQFDEIRSLISTIEEVLNCNGSLQDFGESLKKLTIHENKRWKNCLVSIKHCRLMVNCLHSVPLNHYSPFEWNQHCNELNAFKLQGTRLLFNLQELKCQLQKIIEDANFIAIPLKKFSLVQYIRSLVELLKVEYQVYKHELEIGNLFEQKCQTYFNLVFHNINPKSTAFQIDLNAINRVYQSLCPDQTHDLDLVKSLELNQLILFETKRSLNKAVLQLKTQLNTRHQKFQNLFESILGIETYLSVMQDKT